MPPSSMSNSEKELIDEKFRNKWRSLLSVDDLMAEVIETLDRQVGDSTISSLSIEICLWSFS